MFSLSPDQIKIQPHAMDRFVEYVAQQGGIGLKMSLKNAGCGGFEYQLDVIKEADDLDDEIQYDGGLRLYVPKFDAWRFIGMEIDFETDKTGSRVTYKNPNESGQCGCGLSVNFDQG